MAKLLNKNTELSNKRGDAMSEASETLPVGDLAFLGVCERIQRVGDQPALAKTNIRLLSIFCNHADFRLRAAKLLGAAKLM
jgi:hypothetical protein